MIETLLGRLKAMGVNDERIRITIANGLHRKTTLEEKKRIYGESVLKRFDIRDNDAKKEEDYVGLGMTSSHTPVWMNRRVVESDLIITLGLIKTHAFAGFTGGAKSLLPGVSNRETILTNHRFDFIEYPGGIIGDADLSLPRRDMEEAIQKLNVPIFMTNAVLDSQKRIIQVFSGNSISAHRKGVGFLRDLIEVEVEEPADVLIVEAQFPSSESMYFAVSNMDGMLGSERPIVKEGGMIILLAECREGLGAPVVEELFSIYRSPEKVLNHLRTHPPAENQWSAQRLCFYLSKIRLGIVTRGISREIAEMLHLHYFETLQEAIDSAQSYYGRDMKLIVVRDGYHLIARVKDQAA